MPGWRPAVSRLHLSKTDLVRPFILLQLILWLRYNLFAFAISAIGRCWYWITAFSPFISAGSSPHLVTPSHTLPALYLFPTLPLPVSAAHPLQESRPTLSRKQRRETDRLPGDRPARPRGVPSAFLCVSSRVSTGEGGLTPLGWWSWDLFGRATCAEMRRNGTRWDET